MTKTDQVVEDTILQTEFPQTVTVGPFTWEIKKVKDAGVFVHNETNIDNEITYGTCSFKDMSIYITEDQHQTMVKDTLLHEILHCIWGVVGGWGSNIDEELVVSMFSTILLDTLKKNREVFQFLMGE